jgi:hypothetical protein
MLLVYNLECRKITKKKKNWRASRCPCGVALTNKNDILYPKGKKGFRIIKTADVKCKYKKLLEREPAQTVLLIKKFNLVKT